jgi:hypothetical protein
VCAGFDVGAKGLGGTTGGAQELSCTSWMVTGRLSLVLLRNFQKPDDFVLSNDEDSISSCKSSSMLTGRLLSPVMVLWVFKDMEPVLNRRFELALLNTELFRL